MSSVDLAAAFRLATGDESCPGAPLNLKVETTESLPFLFGGLSPPNKKDFLCVLCTTHGKFLEILLSKIQQDTPPPSRAGIGTHLTLRVDDVI
jgi:hypothetical protein